MCVCVYVYVCALSIYRWTPEIASFHQVMGKVEEMTQHITDIIAKGGPLSSQEYIAPEVLLNKGHGSLDERMGPLGVFF